MTWVDAVLLALLQGLTEFLPVSSSGHLTLMQNLLRAWTGRGLPGALGFDILVHLATLTAVAFYFRRDLLRLARDAGPRSLTGGDGGSHNGRRELALMALALLPTALIGLTLRDLVEALAYRPVIVSVLIGVTGLVLLSTRRRALAAPADVPEPALSAWQALGIGTAQGLAVLPGLSRSGLTIAAGVALGLPPMTAFRWSFLLSMPAILGASLLERAALLQTIYDLGPTAAITAVVAALTGLAALHILARLLKSARLHQFSWYCLAVSAAGVLLFVRLP